MLAASQGRQLPQHCVTRAICCPLLLFQVLYQLFDWPSHPGARLSVVGISNTHDLDQRVLPRIASRLDQAKLAFAPYSVTQLLTIVTARLDSSGVAGALEDAAVQLACRKVASETGEHWHACDKMVTETGQATICLTHHGAWCARCCHP
eukprot:GHRR01033709.1.p1 GENE.GHRR01033709.1~~GHRR01033709.1.p1  ORF type:complete len:149 (-),score=31.83 GHRR01033709.1:137-583(-)